MADQGAAGREEPGSPPVLLKPALRRIARFWWRRFWNRVRALAGLRPSRLVTQEEYELDRLARRVAAWVRRVAVWVMPPVTCVALFVAGRRWVAPTTDVDGLLRSIIPAASLTSGLLAAGLISATTQIKELRRRRVDALRECQGRLQPIRRAFDALVISYNSKTDKGEHLARLLDLMNRVGFGWHEHDASDTASELISVEHINDIVDALEQLSGTLWRPKHYRYLVAELEGRPAAEVQSHHGVVVTKWEGVMHAVYRFNPIAASDGSWRLLSFWEDLVNETLVLAYRTRSISIEVHYQSLTRLRAMFAHLAWLLVVGVALPLIALAFPAIPASRGGLALVATGGMLFVLASTLVLLYRWITERRLHDEGRLEV